MIARHETHTDKRDVWAALSAPLPRHAIEWRVDGNPVEKNGRHIARFVPYVTAQYVRERLDAVVPGEWDLTLEPLPPRAIITRDGEDKGNAIAFKARIQILGVIREDVGEGDDYKGASTDAMKRAAMRFGIAAELYSSEVNWVDMDGAGKYAKPVVDPTDAYVKRYGTLPGQSTKAAVSSSAPAAEAARAAVESGLDMEPVRTTSTRTEEALANVPKPSGSGAPDEPSCPKCGGRMWDNRLTKRNPKAPDFKCRDRSCDGVVWPPKGDKGKAVAAVVETARATMAGEAPPLDDADFPAALEDGDDDLPF